MSANLGAECWGQGTALALHCSISQYLDRESAIHSGLTAAQAGAARYMRSSPGLDAGINRIRGLASKILLGLDDEPARKVVHCQV